MHGRTQATAQPTRSRIGWLDTCRGLCMILVMLLHSTSYYKSLDGQVPECATVIVNGLAPIRMPTLFFLSGMMVHFGLRKGRWQFLLRRAQILVWPYLLWLVIWAFASDNVEKMSGYEWWLGGWYLWFLLFIAAYSIAAAIVPPRYHLVLAAYAYLVSLLMEDGTKYGERLMFFMAIFLAGSFIGRDREWLEERLQDRRILWLVPAGAGILLYSALYGPVRYSPYDGGIIAVVVVLSLAFCRWLGELYPMPLVAALGRNSITAYLVHMPVIAVTISTYRAFGIDSFYPIFLSSLAAAIGVATLAIWLRPRFAPVDWLFSLPARKRR